MATIRCPLRQAYEIAADKTACLDQKKQWIYYELEGLANQLTTVLRKQGIGEGDRVGLLVSNSVSAIAVLFALWRVKAVACPLNTRLPAGSVVQQLQSIEAKTLISDEAFPDAPEDLRVLSLASLVEGVMPRPADGQPTYYDRDQVATILFTSGSSGAPKAAVHTIGAHYYNALGANQNLRISLGDIWLMSLPLFHVGGLGIVLRTIMGGATIALPKPGEALSEELLLSKATHLSLVPTQLRSLILDADAKTFARQLKVVLLGGAPATPDLIDDARRLNFPVFATYGLTEMASQVTTLPIPYAPEVRHSSGRRLKYREIRIGEDGEIRVRGNCLFSGYWVDGKLQSCVDEDGWFSTGDLGSQDPDGYLTVTGRRDNLIISGGENIHPEEIEQVLFECLPLSHAVVVPVDDAKFGQRPVAYVKSDEPMKFESWPLLLEEYLPRFKMPVAFYDLPDEAVAGMKVDRAIVKELAEKLGT